MIWRIRRWRRRHYITSPDESPAEFRQYLGDLGAATLGPLDFRCPCGYEYVGGRDPEEVQAKAYSHFTEHVTGRVDGRRPAPTWREVQKSLEEARVALEKVKRRDDH